MARPRLDFKAIKEAADFEVILARAGLMLKREGAELVGLCPFHEDTRPSFHANPTKKVWQCFGCKSHGNSLDFVARHERLSIRAAAERIALWCGLPIGVSDRARSTGEGENGRRTDPTPTPIDAPAPPERREAPDENRPLTFALKLLHEHPYLASRGLDPKTVEYFGLGYASRGMMKGRVCIPLHNEHGELVAYLGRYPADDLPDGESKYKLPTGFQKAAFVYNLHRVLGFEHLTVVEGPFGVFKLHELGLPAVALLGSSMSARQEELLALTQARRLTLFLDGDEAGRAAAHSMLPRLAVRFYTRIVDFGPNTQPDTLPDSELRRLIPKEESCP